MRYLQGNHVFYRSCQDGVISSSSRSANAGVESRRPYYTKTVKELTHISAISDWRGFGMIEAGEYYRCKTSEIQALERVYSYRQLGSQIILE